MGGWEAKRGREGERKRVKRLTWKEKGIGPVDCNETSNCEWPGAGTTAGEKGVRHP